MILLISASWVARITGVSHQHLVIGLCFWSVQITRYFYFSLEVWMCHLLSVPSLQTWGQSSKATHSSTAILPLFFSVWRVITMFS
jgi:hypothetical protein